MGGITNSPRSAGLPDAEMELLEMTNRILLVLPVCSILLRAESTSELGLHLLQESMIRPREAEPMVMIHSVDFLLRQGTDEYIWGHSVRKSLGDRGDSKVLPSSLSG